VGNSGGNDGVSGSGARGVSQGRHLRSMAVEAVQG
jgi:hypothetical protein